MNRLTPEGELFTPRLPTSRIKCLLHAVDFQEIIKLQVLPWCLLIYVLI